MNNKKKQQVCFLLICYIFFLLINLFLIFVHEPWRDEVHAWLMAKNMSIPELISFSAYEGHPVLWHIILIPFARNGFPIWCINIISFILVGISAFFFLFYTRINSIIKILFLYTVPFVYAYSVISRNYCIILLCVVLISILYKKRYEYPFLFSLPIFFLVFSHVLAWGFVAGVTITFHIYEIFLFLLKKSNLPKNKIRSICAGFGLIVFASIFVVITMSNGGNEGVYAFLSYPTYQAVIELAVISIIVLVIALKYRKQTVKEAFIVVISNAFIIIVYLNVYSSLILQRELLPFIFVLFYYISTYDKEKMKYNVVSLIILFYLPLWVFGGGKSLLLTINADIKYNFSSAKQMAEYINNNIPEEEVVLVDAGIMCQTIVPYTDKKLYDIVYKEYIEDSLYHNNDADSISNRLIDIFYSTEYENMYLVSNYLNEDIGGRFIKIYETEDSITQEKYTLYYISTSEEEGTKDYE